jgi:hypothetical protein
VRRAITASGRAPVHRAGPITPLIHHVRGRPCEKLQAVSASSPSPHRGHLCHRCGSLDIRFLFQKIIDLVLNASRARRHPNGQSMPAVRVQLDQQVLDLRYSGSFVRIQ